MKNSFIKALWNAAKEPLRWAVLSVIPIVIAQLELITAQWAVILIVLLRIADKVLHEIGKEIENEDLAKGITRF